MTDLHFPETGDTWRHHNGVEYVVDVVANQYSNREEYPPTVVYHGENGKVWAKPFQNFLDKMTFVSRAVQQPCEAQPLNLPSLGIQGMVAGSVYNGLDEADAAQADIDMHMHKNHGGSDNFWHAMIHVNARTPEKAEELRDLVMQGLAMATNPPVLYMNCQDPAALEDLRRALDQYPANQRLELLLGDGVRDSLDFESLLAQYHAEVWAAAEGEDDLGVLHEDYDTAGVGTAKQLIAMYRGEAKYTHHNDLPAYSTEAIREGLADADAGRIRSIEDDAGLPPLIVRLRTHGQQIAEQAFDAQEQAHSPIKATQTMTQRFEKPGE